MTPALFRDALAGALSAANVRTNADLIVSAATVLADRYTEPNRAYHDSTHIAAMLYGLDANRASARAAHEIALAILFHDVVYDPRRSDNEAASASCAETAMTSLGFAPQQIARVAGLIMATQHGAREPAPDDTDCALLLDLDLAILGSAPDAYRAYAAAIRREYAHVPDVLYRPGRTHVLKTFLAQPNIYRTPKFRARYEVQARANLAAEVTALGDA